MFFFNSLRLRRSSSSRWRQDCRRHQVQIRWLAVASSGQRIDLVGSLHQEQVRRRFSVRSPRFDSRSLPAGLPGVVGGRTGRTRHLRGHGTHGHQPDQGQTRRRSPRLQSPHLWERHCHFGAGTGRPAAAAHCPHLFAGVTERGVWGEDGHCVRMGSTWIRFVDKKGLFGSKKWNGLCIFRRWRPEHSASSLCPNHWKHQVSVHVQPVRTQKDCPHFILMCRIWPGQKRLLRGIEKTAFETDFSRLLRPLRQKSLLYFYLDILPTYNFCFINFSEISNGEEFWSVF